MDSTSTEEPIRDPALRDPDLAHLFRARLSVERMEAIQARVAWVDPWRHGVILGVVQADYADICYWIDYYLCAKPNKGAWWTKLPGGVWGVEFVAMHKVSPPPQKPWEWDGTTLLFGDWQDQVRAERDAARQLHLQYSDRVRFQHKGQLLEGLFVGGRTRASVLVGPLKYSVPYSALERI